MTDEKIDHMLGMVQNMMNMAEKNSGKEMMDEMYSMSSIMMGNLHYMKLNGKTNDNLIEMIELVTRSMENMMSKLNIEDDKEKSMMKYMMDFMITTQMAIINFQMKY